MCFFFWASTFETVKTAVRRDILMFKGHIFRFIILFWVTTSNRFTCFNAQITQSIFCTLSSVAALYSVLYSISCHLPSWIASRLWLVGSHMPDSAPLKKRQQSSCVKSLLTCQTAVRHQLCKCVTLWHSVVSQSHGIEGETNDNTFQEYCFLGWCKVWKPTSQTC